MYNSNNSNNEVNLLCDSTEFNINEVCHDISNLKNVVTSNTSNDEQVFAKLVYVDKLAYIDKLIETLYYKDEINKINNILEYGHVFKNKPIEISELKHRDEILNNLWGTDAFDKELDKILLYLDSDINYLTESLNIFYDAMCSHYATFYGDCNYDDFKKSSQV